MPVALSAIEDVAVRDWVTGETITPGKLAKDYRAIKDAVNLIIRFLREMEKRFASGEPIDKANGFLWYDAATALLKLYRSGAWEEVMTEETAGSTDIKAGGGTDTGKLGGAINVDTAPQAVVNYTVPANTLSENEFFLRNIAWRATVVDAVIPLWGAAPTGLMSHLHGTNSIIVETLIIRTAAGSQKWVSWLKAAVDASGSTSLVGSGTASEDETTALEIGATVPGTEDMAIVMLNC